MRTYIHTCIYVDIYGNELATLYMYVYMYMRKHKCVRVFFYHGIQGICIHIYIGVYVYIHTYMYICGYIRE